MNLASLPKVEHFSPADVIAILRAPVFDPYALLRPLLPLTPALALSALFFSSTIYTEAITASKYARYATYKARVGMFSPLETLMKGFFLSLTGKKGPMDKELWGSDVGKLE